MTKFIMLIVLSLSAASSFAQNCEYNFKLIAEGLGIKAPQLKYLDRQTKTLYSSYDAMSADDKREHTKFAVQTFFVREQQLKKSVQVYQEKLKKWFKKEGKSLTIENSQAIAKLDDLTLQISKYKNPEQRFENAEYFLKVCKGLRKDCSPLEKTFQESQAYQALVEQRNALALNLAHLQVEDRWNDKDLLKSKQDMIKADNDLKVARAAMDKTNTSAEFQRSSTGSFIVVLASEKDMQDMPFMKSAQVADDKESLLALQASQVEIQRRIASGDENINQLRALLTEVNKKIELTTRAQKNRNAYLYVHPSVSQTGELDYTVAYFPGGLPLMTLTDKCAFKSADPVFAAYSRSCVGLPRDQRGLGCDKISDVVSVRTNMEKAAQMKRPSWSSGSSQQSYPATEH